jgi:hypothetical protein
MLSTIKMGAAAFAGLLVGASIFALWATLIYGPTRYALGHIAGERDCAAKVQAAVDDERVRQAAENDAARASQRRRLEDLSDSLARTKDELDILHEQAQQASVETTVREDGSCDPVRGISTDSMRTINRY